MSEKFTIAVWNADGTPKTGASVALLGAGTYSGTELGTSGRYYWASIPLGKYFLRVNGVDTGESFAVGDGEVAGLGYSDRAFIKSSANSLNLANLIIDDIESLQETLDNKLDVINKKSQIINGSSLLEFEALSGDGGSYFHTLKQVGLKSFETYSSSNVVGSNVSAVFSEPSVSSASAQAVANDGQGRLIASWSSFVSGDYSNFDLSASVDGIKIQHEINGVYDFLLFPTVTGATKTLATLESPSFSGMITVTGSGPVSDFVRTSTDTNQLRYASLLTHATTADMVDGFGVQKAFLIKDSAGVANVIGALGFRRAGADNTGEWVLTCISGGASTVVATAKSAEFTLSQLLKTSASTTTRAGVNLPHGTAPTSPVNGDKWTTTAGEFTRVNGVTYETAVKSSLGNLQLISLGNTAIGQNSVTGERGHLVRMVNGTGANSVKGTLISASTTTDNQFVLQANEFDAFGVVAESGIASGQECWIWVNGSTCEVLWQDGQSSTRGYLALCAPTDGRALNVAVPDSNPTVGEHFKEIGHVLQSKVSGTNVMVLCQIHFN